MPIVSKTIGAPVPRTHSTTTNRSTMPISDTTTNRPDRNNKNTRQLNRDRRGWRKTHTALRLCAEVATAVTLTGCTYPFRLDCHPGTEIVTDGGISNKVINKASPGGAKAKSTFTGSVSADYPLDDLIAQLDGGQVQLDCDYGDSAHWPMIDHNELTFSTKPYVQFPAATK